MKRIPFYPLYQLCRIIRSNGGIPGRNALHTITWLVKTILIEPLRWIELLFFERKVNEHKIRLHPVFILGHYRSGTTFLQRLLMQDSRLGYMSIFQSVLPEILLSFEGVLTRVGDVVVRLFPVKNPFHRIPFTWNFPGEDDVGMTALLSTRGVQWGLLFPDRNDHYMKKYIIFKQSSGDEKEQWKNEYSYLLKKLSLRNKGKRLVLKSTPNTARIKELLELFPDARFIFIHRNPLEVYASTKRLWNIILDKYVLGACVFSEIPQKIMNNYSQVMDRYLQQRQMIPAGRLVEVAYQDLVEEPLITMQKIYEQVSMDGFYECKNKMQAFATDQQHYIRLEHSIDPVEKRKVLDCWKKYFEEWKYPMVDS
jgi:hypothetical protein